ncbi:MAG: putative glycosyl transferase, partial [Glaciihabitans sp.]|nr:putative glycosyl transferase [Glaciihabitans sp.]
THRRSPRGRLCARGLLPRRPLGCRKDGTALITTDGSADSAAASDPTALDPAEHEPTKHHPTKHHPTKHIPTKHVPTKHTSTGHVSTEHEQIRPVPIKHVPIKHVVVVIPARNEEGLIERCLRSVLAAGEYARLRLGEASPSLGIVVVADSCTDSTATIAAAVPGVQVVHVDAANVGTARATGVTTSLGTLGGEGDVDDHALSHVWVACTDADSVVPPQWIVEQAALAADGADLMIGTVRPEFVDLTPAQVALWTATHIPGRPNGHVHGANLGIRASAYRAAKGFEPMPEHEDVDLVRRVRQLGHVIVASDDCEVLTSGRRVGRTPGGYAAYLQRQRDTISAQPQPQPQPQASASASARSVHADSATATGELSPVFPS